MPNNRISILVALEGADDGLRRALHSAQQSLGDLSSHARTAGQQAQAGLAQVQAGVSAFSEQFGRARTQLVAYVFTSDTLAEATQRHQERMAQMKQTFAEMIQDKLSGSPV
jgi:uncharacterized membrane protein